MNYRVSGDIVIPFVVELDEDPVEVDDLFGAVASLLNIKRTTGTERAVVEYSEPLGGSNGSPPTAYRASGDIRIPFAVELDEDPDAMSEEALFREVASVLDFRKTTGTEYVALDWVEAE